MKLIDALASETLSEYTDSYRQNALALIEQKKADPSFQVAAARAQGPCSGCRLRGGDGTKPHIALILMLLTVLAGCGGNAVPNIRPKALNSISLDAPDWYFMYGSGTSEHPDPSGSEWAFDVPNAPGSIHYLQTPANLTTVPKSITMIFRIDASASASYGISDSSDYPPASFHLFLERQDDDLAKDYYRWWGDVGYDFGSFDDTTRTITIPLTAEHWSSVFGHHDQGEFNATLSNLAYVGITYGGHDFFGHGVYMATGSARFVLLDYHFNY